MNAEKTGLFISELRKEKGLTQKQLADELFVSDKAISRWETGRGFPEISILERIGEVLDVSVAELIRGERISGDVSESEVKYIASGSTDLARGYIDRNRIRYVVSGILLGMIILLTAIVHLNSPVYYDDPGVILRIETLSDNRLAAVIDSKVTGYDLWEYNEQNTDGHYFVIMCYSTKWDQWFGERREKMAVFGDREDIDWISYSPAGDSSGIIYQSRQLGFDGMSVLPRLIYNWWIVFGTAGTVVTGILYLLFRKRYLGEIMLKIMLLPLSFTVSLFMTLWGRFNKVYDAQYYFTFIVLMTIMFYVLALVVYRIIRDKQHKINTDNKI